MRLNSLTQTHRFCGRGKNKIRFFCQRIIRISRIINICCEFAFEAKSNSQQGLYFFNLEHPALLAPLKLFLCQALRPDFGLPAPSLSRGGTPAPLCIGSDNSFPSPAKSKAKQGLRSPKIRYRSSINLKIKNNN